MPVQQPDYVRGCDQQVLDSHGMTAALTHMSARMDAIEAWAATVSETVSLNASAIDQQIMELIESLGDKASMAVMQEVDGHIMHEAM